MCRKMALKETSPRLSMGAHQSVSGFLPNLPVFWNFNEKFDSWAALLRLICGVTRYSDRMLEAARKITRIKPPIQIASPKPPIRGNNIGINR